MGSTGRRKSWELWKRHVSHQREGKSTFPYEEGDLNAVSDNADFLVIHYAQL